MSSKDPWNDSQSESPTPLKKKGMSGCMLAGLIVGGLGLIGMVVCCGSLALILPKMMPIETKVPAEVAAVGQRILNAEILDEFNPESAVTMDNMIFTFRIVKFKHKEGKGEMTLGSMKLHFGDPKQANDSSRQMRGKFEDEVRGSLDVKKTESHEITINHQKVSVAIAEATDRITGKEVHTASADFDRPSGQTFLLLRLDDDAWDQEAVLKMLEEAKMPE